MSTDELWVRVFVLVPLIIITVQAILLRRLLQSIAWTLITAGFVVFVAIRVASLFIRPFPTIPGLTGYLVGYGLIATGFWTLHRDLLRVLHGVATMTELKEARNADESSVNTGP